MTSGKKLFEWIFVIGCLSTCRAAPATVAAPSTKEEMLEELLLDEDDSTTRSLERLVSAATCLVAGIEYTHGQQIYRSDPCEFCLCLDGEMFCWWQDCPPVAAGPCRDRRPFSPCAPGRAEAPVAGRRRQQGAPGMRWPPDNGTSPDPLSVAEGANGSTSAEPATASPAACLVMGVEYKIGEMLPHDTGNCVECVCGQGARVSCSPHLCSPPEDDASYQPAGSRTELTEVF